MLVDWKLRESHPELYDNMCDATAQRDNRRGHDTLGDRGHDGEASPSNLDARSVLSSSFHEGQSCDEVGPVHVRLDLGRHDTGAPDHRYGHLLPTQSLLSTDDG